MRIAEFALARPQFTGVVYLLLLALGLLAALNIPRQEDPSFENPSTAITVVFPGAEPVDVERLAVDPIEDRLAELDDVKEIHSKSDNGVGVISIEFDWGSDPDRKYDEVVREVNAVRASLPEQVTEISFRRANPNLVNIAQWAIVSVHSSALELKNMAEDLEERIETVPGIRRAEAWGFPWPEVRVSIDLTRTTQLGLTLDGILSAVTKEGINIPGGAVEAGGRRYNLKTSGDFRSVEQVGETVVAGTDSGLIRLRDVASIDWATEEVRYLARYNGQRAAFVTANMKDGYNIFEVQDALSQRVAEFAAALPPEVRIEQGFDQADNVSDRLRRLAVDFAIALGLVLITLAPLGLRAAGIVIVAIPMSLAMGLAALWALGYSINQISIAGFIVSLGLLVDDAIVVIENIARRLREGLSRTEAALQGTSQVALAVIGCTAALLFAFLPLLNLPEAAGAFTRGLPLAVVLTIAASLIVALTLVPFLARRFLVPEQSKDGNKILQWVRAGIHRCYAPVMHRALAAPRATLLFSGAFVVGSFALVPALGFSLFPAADKPQFLITISAPDGAALDTTDRALQWVERELIRHPQVRTRMSNLGRGNPFIYYNMPPLETKANTAEILVVLESWQGGATRKFLDELRNKFAAYPDAQIMVKQFKNGPPVEAPLAVRVIGPQLQVLERLAAEVAGSMAGVAGVRDIVNPIRMPRLDLDIGLDHTKAALIGVSSDQVDRTVLMAVSGVTAANYRDQRGDSYPVRLRLPMLERPQLSMLESLQLHSERSGAKVPLAQVSNLRFDSGPTQIERYARERMVTVTAEVEQGLPIADISTEVYRRLDALQLPSGYRIAAGGDAEATAQSVGGLGAASLVAVFGIIAVLILEFGSFRSLWIVLGVIPFGIAGALWALFVTGYPLSYTAILGFVALIGVEIKNSILLVDFANAARLQGLDLDSAIESAGEQRFLPVLLTSLTAVGGLLPLAASGSGLYAPLAIVMIGGLLSSTLLARIVTPVMYKLLPPSLPALSGTRS